MKSQLDSWSVGHSKANRESSVWISTQILSTAKVCAVRRDAEAMPLFRKMLLSLHNPPSEVYDLRVMDGGQWRVSQKATANGTI